MKRKQNGVYVVITCPQISLLRQELIDEHYKDIPIDRFISLHIEDIMSDLIMDYIDHNRKEDDNYYVLVEPILIHMSNFVTVLNTKRISFMYDDTLLIHC